MIKRNNLDIFPTKIIENHIVNVVWTTRGPEPFASPFVVEVNYDPFIALLVAANVPTAIIQTGQKKKKSKDSS